MCGERQAKPQLAGKWQLDGARTKAANLSGWGEGVSLKWEGSRVVIVTVRLLEASPARSTMEYALDGETLVVSTTAPPRGGGNPVTNKLYYKRGASSPCPDRLRSIAAQNSHGFDPAGPARWLPGSQQRGRKDECRDGA